MRRPTRAIAAAAAVAGRGTVEGVGADVKAAGRTIEGCTRHQTQDETSGPREQPGPWHLSVTGSG